MTRLTDSTLDHILTWQVLVAWAGEGHCDPVRLGWWRTDLVDEYGGGDLFQRIFPKTHSWASLEAVRQAAIQTDQDNRMKMAQPDRIQTLFFWGFSMDEQLSDRLAEHKQRSDAPEDCLKLPMDFNQEFSRLKFEECMHLNSTVKLNIVPDGRELLGMGTLSPELQVQNLVSALLPLSERYPMPFYRIGELS